MLQYQGTEQNTVAPVISALGVFLLVGAGSSVKNYQQLLNLPETLSPCSAETARVLLCTLSK